MISEPWHWVKNEDIEFPDESSSTSLSENTQTIIGGGKSKQNMQLSEEQLEFKGKTEMHVVNYSRRKKSLLGRSTCWR